MQGGFFFFLVIILFFFGLWVVTGGPTKAISFAGPYITPITGPGDTPTGYGATSTISKYNVGITLPGVKASVSENGSAAPSSQTSSGTTYDASQEPTGFGTPSPYAGIITMDHSVEGTYSTDPSQEYIELHDSANASKNVDITGWKIESTVTANNATIPTGVRTPHTTTTNTVQDIVLYPGDTAVLTTGSSPLGYSFRDNECIGYLTQGLTLNSGLSGYCPSAVSDFNADYPGNPLSDDSCYAYVQNVQSCSVPNAPQQNLTTACRTFIAQHLTYDGCVATHTSDSSFAGDTWFVYLNHGARLWKNSRDTIKLLDASGRTVDMFTY